MKTSTFVTAVALVAVTATIQPAVGQVGPSAPIRSDTAASPLLDHLGRTPGTQITELPSEEIRKWDAELYETYRVKIKSFTGKRNAQGQLLGLNDEVLEEITQIGVKMIQDQAIADVRQVGKTFAQQQNLPRPEKLELLADLKVKAGAVRDAKAAMDAAARRFQSYQSQQVLYENQLAKQKALEELGDTDGVTEIRQQIQRNFFFQRGKTQRRYARLIDDTPILGVKVDGTYFYDALANPSVPEIDLLNTYLTAGLDQQDDQAVRLTNMTDIEEAAQFASDRFAGPQNRLIELGQRVGSPFLINTMLNLRDEADGSLKDWSAEAWEKTLDQGLVVVAVGSVLLPGGVVISAAVTEIQIARAINEVVIAYADAENAEALSSAVGFAPVIVAREQVDAANKNLIVTTASSAFDWIALGQQFKIWRAADTAAAERGALQVLGSSVAPLGGPGGTQVLRPVELPPGAFLPNGEVYLASALNVGSPNHVPAQLMLVDWGLMYNARLNARAKQYFLPDGTLVGKAELDPNDFNLILEKGGLQFIDDAANRGFVLDSVFEGASSVSGVRNAFVPILDDFARNELRDLFMNEMVRRNYVFDGVNVFPRPPTLPGAAPLSLPATSSSLPAVGSPADLGARAVDFAGNPVRVAREAQRAAELIPEPTLPEYASDDRFGSTIPPDSRGALQQRLSESQAHLKILNSDGALLEAEITRQQAAINQLTTAIERADGDTRKQLQTERFEAQEALRGLQRDLRYLNADRDAEQWQISDLEKRIKQSAAVPPAAAPSPAPTPTRDFGAAVPAAPLRFATSIPSGPGFSLAPKSDFVAKADFPIRLVRPTDDPLKSTAPPAVLTNLVTPAMNPAFINVAANFPKYQIVVITSDGLVILVPAAFPPAAMNPPSRIERLLPWLQRSATAALTLLGVRYPAVVDSTLSTARGPSRFSALTHDTERTHFEQSNDITVLLTSLGRSAGDAFEMTILNRGTTPVRLDAPGIVLEPVANVTHDAVAKAVAAAKTAGRATATVKGYCLEMLKLPPTAGMVFRLAAEAVQRRHAQVERILAASRTLRAAGGLSPPAGDPSEAVEYFDAIRQWAIWTREQSFDERSYARAFVEHSRKNIESAGRRWSSDLERAIAALAPARWAAIQQVLREAAIAP